MIRKWIALLLLIKGLLLFFLFGNASVTGNAIAEHYFGISILQAVGIVLILSSIILYFFSMKKDNFK
jgi:hypothetical protein